MERVYQEEGEIEKYSKIRGKVLFKYIIFTAFLAAGQFVVNFSKVDCWSNS